MNIYTNPSYLKICILIFVAFAAAILIFSLANIGNGNKTLNEEYNKRLSLFLDEIGVTNNPVSLREGDYSEDEALEILENRMKKIQEDPEYLSLYENYRMKVLAYEKQLFKYVLFGLFFLWAIIFYMFNLNKLDLMFMLIPVGVGYVTGYLSFVQLIIICFALFSIYWMVRKFIQDK